MGRYRLFRTSLTGIGSNISGGVGLSLRWPEVLDDIARLLWGGGRNQENFGPQPATRMIDRLACMLFFPCVLHFIIPF